MHPTTLDPQAAARALSHLLTLENGRLHWWQYTTSPSGALQREPGKRAGGRYGGVLCVHLTGWRVPAAQIAWALHYGTWPAHDVHPLDRDPHNFARDNLAPGSAPRKPRAGKYDAINNMTDGELAAFHAMQDAMAARANALRAQGVPESAIYAVDDDPLG